MIKGYYVGKSALDMYVQFYERRINAPGHHEASDRPSHQQQKTVNVNRSSLQMDFHHPYFLFTNFFNVFFSVFALFVFSVVCGRLSCFC